MLQRTPPEDLRLPPKDLGITQREYDGLISIRGRLADGSIPHHTSDDSGLRFNMSTWCLKNLSCCLGGLMEVYGYIDARRQPSLLDGWLKRKIGPRYSSPLRALFYPNELFYPNWCDLTPADAVRAIDCFLQGHPFPWVIAMEHTAFQDATGPYRDLIALQVAACRSAFAQPVAV